MQQSRTDLILTRARALYELHRRRFFEAVAAPDSTDGSAASFPDWADSAFEVRKPYIAQALQELDGEVATEGL